MTAALRWAGITALAAAVTLTWRAGAGMLAGAIGLGIVAHAALRTGARAMLRNGVPALLFALGLLALQWLGGAVDIRAPLRAIAVFSLSTAAARLVPMPGLTALCPGSRRRLPLLFLLFIRHFTVILTGEITRVFQARSLCIPCNCSRSGFQSLAWAAAAVLRRSLERAERFYAAQAAGGFPE